MNLVEHYGKLNTPARQNLDKEGKIGGILFIFVNPIIIFFGFFK